MELFLTSLATFVTAVLTSWAAVIGRFHPPLRPFGSRSAVISSSTLIAAIAATATMTGLLAAWIASSSVRALIGPVLFGPVVASALTLAKERSQPGPELADAEAPNIEKTIVWMRIVTVGISCLTRKLELTLTHERTFWAAERVDAMFVEPTFGFDTAAQIAARIGQAHPRDREEAELLLTDYQEALTEMKALHHEAEFSPDRARAATAARNGLHALLALAYDQKSDAIVDPLIDAGSSHAPTPTRIQQPSPLDHA